jgi:PPOX class probable F420-dependent enzyme
MSDDEVRGYLESRKTIILVSNGRGGHPHPMPMWFVVDEDGAVRMTTFRASQKVKNLRRDPRVSLLAEDGEDYSELRGVVLYGRAEIVEDLEVIKATLKGASAGDDAAETPKDPEVLKSIDAAMERTAAKRVCIRVRPDRVVSWDHRKLGGSY